MVEEGAGGCGGGGGAVRVCFRPPGLCGYFIPSVCSAAALWPDCSGIFWRNPGGEQHRQRSVNAAQPRTPDREPGRRPLTPGFPPQKRLIILKMCLKTNLHLWLFPLAYFSFGSFGLTCSFF